MQHLPHLIRLTDVKDRGTTDVVLVQVLCEILSPVRARLCEIATDAQGDRCLTLAQCHSDPGNTPTETLGHAAGVLVSSDAVLQAAVKSGDCVIDTSAGLQRLLVPFRTEVGQLYLLDLASPSPWTEGQRAMVEGFGMVYRNFVNLIDHGERDSLTGLLNRKSFDEAFLKVARAIDRRLDTDPLQRRKIGESAPQYWLAVIDIDHFKQVNDRFGHLIGDEVLLLLARVMRSSFRYGDRLYRFGGEEFVVLLGAQHEDEAAAVFERLRTKVEQFPFPQVQRVTVSIGFTQIRAQDTPTSAFDRADKVLYQAKSTGRNRVCGYEDQLSQGQIQLQETENLGVIELF